MARARLASTSSGLSDEETSRLTSSSARSRCAYRMASSYRRAFSRAVAAWAAKLWSSARSSTPKEAASTPARLLGSTPQGRALPLDVGQRDDVRPTRALDQEEGRVLEGERGWVGEGLQRRGFLLGEAASDPVGDAEGADDRAFGAPRHRQHRAVA